MFTAHLDELVMTLRGVLEVLFSVGKSPTVATELVEIINGTMERAIQAHSEGQWKLLLDNDISSPNSRPDHHIHQ